MFKVLILFLTFFTFLFSAQIPKIKKMAVDYRVEFGIVGEVGRVHTEYQDNSKNYTIDAHVQAVGILAKQVTDNLKERHICKGYITKRGIRIATSYQMIKSYGKYKSMTYYRVNHKTKKIQKTYKKWLTRPGKSDRKIEDSTYDLDYYAVDDMLTLFLNLSYKIKNKTMPKHYRFKAVGADREHGNVDIIIPTQKQANEMSKLVGKADKGEWLMNLVMHRQLYGSKQGELMVHMGKGSIVEKAVLKDLIFFGDVRIIKK